MYKSKVCSTCEDEKAGERRTRPAPKDTIRFILRFVCEVFFGLCVSRTKHENTIEQSGWPIKYCVFCTNRNARAQIVLH